MRYDKNSLHCRSFRLVEADDRTGNVGFVLAVEVCVCTQRQGGGGASYVIVGQYGRTSDDSDYAQEGPHFQPRFLNHRRIACRVQGLHGEYIPLCNITQEGIVHASSKNFPKVYGSLCNEEGLSIYSLVTSASSPSFSLIAPPFHLFR